MNILEESIVDRIVTIIGKNIFLMKYLIKSFFTKI